VRLFFAAELPAAVRSALARLEVEDAAYRWVNPAQLHVTLAFLGEQPEARLPDLEAIGQAAAAASEAGRLRLGEPGGFGPRSAPRVLWIGLAGDVPALLRLHTALADRLRVAAFPVEDRPFQAHITLARRRERAPSRSPAPWPPRDRVRSAAIPLEALTLFQSRLSLRGATYIPLGQWPLGG
jgi:RNA 2',3'-cyclic 3'-phosphodiesterase